MIAQAHRLHGWILWLLLWLAPASLLAQPGGSDAPPEAQARALLDAGNAREAVAVLKAAIAQHPDEKVLRWLLTRAYLLDGNDAWAMRTLSTMVQGDPADCRPLLWMAWIHIKQGTLEDARSLLSDAHCDPGSPEETRRVLLLGRVEQYRSDPEEALRLLTRARRAEQIFPEDRAVLDRLSGALEPGRPPPFSGKLDLALGYASNAFAGSPTDPASQGESAAGPVGQLNLWLRYAGESEGWARPSFEIEGRALGYKIEKAEDFSYLILGGRPGVLIGQKPPFVLLAYRFETLLLAGGDRYSDGPIWFTNAHRAEAEADLLPNLTVFGGAGRRLFRQSGRSRIEVDGGIGGSLLPLPKLRFLGALTGRWHEAENEAYDLIGGSLLLSGEYKLPLDWAVRVGVLTSLDGYPRSAGAFDPLAPDTNRRDILLRLSTSVFTPTFWDIKAGITYEFAKRFSTAAPYDYQDHRVLLKLVWNFTSDPWAPDAVAPPGHVPLDHGIVGSGFDERLQDLLRQDEAAQRSSSCMD